MEGLLLLKAQITNIGPLKDIELVLGAPGIYVITGKNGAGKTTVLQALDYLLRAFPKGESSPVNINVEEGKIVAYIGNKEDGLCLLNGDGEKKYKYKITRRFTSAGPKPIEVEHIDFPNGLKKPRTILNSFLTDLKSLDPWDFINLGANEQIDALLKIIDIPFDKVRLAQIIGMDGEDAGEIVWPSNNPIDCINASYRKLYDMRTEKNRYFDIAQKACDAIEIPAEYTGAKHITFDTLLEEKEGLREKEEKNKEKREIFTHLNNTREKTLRKIDENFEYERMASMDIQLEIDELKQQLEKFTGRLKELKENCANERISLKIYVQKLGKAMEDQKITVENLPLVDYVEINNKIANVELNNKAAANLEEKAKNELKVKKYRDESLNLTKMMGDVTEYKQQLLQQTKFPTEGLSFDESGLILNGHAFKRNGQADQLIAAFNILKTQNPTLKIVLSFSETQMDKEHTVLLEKLAIKAGFQFLCCHVAEEKVDGKFFIENGVLV